MQAQRYWIEAAFHDAKSDLGMADYEVRGWIGWHHHMAMVCLAMKFILSEKLLHLDSVPLLSTRDVVELMAYYLPRRVQDRNELIYRIEERHQARLRDIENRYQRQHAGNEK